MTAEKQSKLDTLDFLSFITPLGEVIHKYPINEAISDALVLSTEEYRLPNVSFYLRLEGKDNSKSTTEQGYIFIRKYIHFPHRRQYLSSSPNRPYNPSFY